MAISKNIDLDNGFQATYHVIMSANIHAPDNSADLMVYSFKDQAAFDDGLKFAFAQAYQAPAGTLTHAFIGSSELIDACYVWLATHPDFA